jgi:CheY-like chemotaxis protein
MAYLWLQRALRLTPDMIVADITMSVMHGHSGATHLSPLTLRVFAANEGTGMKLPPSY